MATLPFENNFSGILWGRSREACLPNLKFVSIAVLHIAFNAHNLQGHVTLTTPPVRKFLRIGSSQRQVEWSHGHMADDVTVRMTSY